MYSGKKLGIRETSFVIYFTILHFKNDNMNKKNENGVKADSRLTQLSSES